MIQKGNWIRHRKCKKVLQVLKVRANGLLEVEWRDRRGELQRRTITRPEEYVIEKKWRQT